MAVGVCAGQGCFPFREHSPSQGRWISPDPLGSGAATLANPQSWNRYAYALTNPLNAVDPAGLDCVYLDDSGMYVEEVDTGDCDEGTGGTWVPGTFTGEGFVDTSDGTIVGLNSTVN